MDYFASDFHIEHNREFIYKNRGFNSIEEHDKALFKEVREKLTTNDTLYYLGDFSFRHTVNEILEDISHIPCKVIFITGNHDKNIIHYKKYIPERFTFVGSLFDYRNKGINISLCHYPLRVWNKSHFNSWHLYGHLHSETDFGGKTLNITVDNTKQFIISLDEVAYYMKNRPNNYDYIKKE